MWGVRNLLLTVGIAAVVAAMPATGLARTPRSVDASASPTSKPPLVKAWLTATPGQPLPRSFLGLSTESWDVPGLDVRPGVLQRIFALLRVPGDGPMSFRVGGQSTEQTYWAEPDLGPGVDNYHPDPDWLRTLASMARASHLKLMLALNLVADSPSMAAAFVRAARAGLPSQAVSAFEVGNEPDIGHRMVPNPLASPGPVPHTPQGWDQYTESAYLARFHAYQHAVLQIAPHAPLAGPDSYFPKSTAGWMSHLAAMRSPAPVAMLTVHRYALASCANPAWHDYASIPHLLAQYTTGGLAHSVLPAVRVARRARLGLRVSEFNSVTCGGSHGVSDSFATALWAPDALFSMWKIGVSGVNLHVQLGSPNAPFLISSSGMVARPLLYGMLMFARALGPGARLVPVRISGARPHNIKIWGVRTNHNLNLLLLNKGAVPVQLVTALAGRGRAHVQRLTSPAVDATSGERLAGQTLSRQGRWLGHRTLQSLPRSSAGTYTAELPAYSEALLTVSR